AGGGRRPRPLLLQRTRVLDRVTRDRRDGSRRPRRGRGRHRRRGALRPLLVLPVRGRDRARRPRPSGARWSRSRPLTVTGGLGFAGGPANNYPTHAIAAMVDACRQDPGSIGMVSALGWYVTKHSIGVYSTAPPERGFSRVDPASTQANVDALPGREPA